MNTSFLLRPALPAAFIAVFFSCTPPLTPPKLDGAYSTEDGNGELTVSAQDANGFHFLLSVSSGDGNCLGDQDGSARFLNDSTAAWGDEKKCHLEFYFHKGVITVVEKPNADGSHCDTHGERCSFDGVFLRHEKKPAAADEFNEYLQLASSAYGSKVDTTWLGNDSILVPFDIPLYYRSGSEELCKKEGSILFRQNGDILVSGTDTAKTKSGTWKQRTRAYVAVTREGQTEMYFVCGFLTDEGESPWIFINTATKKTTILEIHQ